MTVETAFQESYLFQANIEKTGPQIVGGRGVRVDVKFDGKVQNGMIDAVAGAAVGALGWADEDVYEIINEAARSSTYSYPALLSNESAEELAKFYIENSPKGVFAAALWCTSGSESNENALRIIRQYWVERGLPEKTKIISRENSYHGFSLGAQSISSNPRIDAFSPLLIDQKNICVKMPCAYTYRFKEANETEEEYAQRLLDILEDKILEHTPEKVGTVIVETLPGSALGTSPPPKGYLKGIRALCNKYDIIFHLDEVMCGTGRCNPNGGLNCWENFLDPCDAPDIQTVGKTLGSGYVTIAGVLVGPKIRNAFLEGSGSIIGGHTYSCHAFNCAVALGIQKKIKKEKLSANVFKMGNLMGQKLKDKLLSADNIAGDVRGIGGFWTVEFVQDRVTKKMFDTSLNVAGRFKQIAYKNGITLICMPSVKDNVGDIAVMAPSFIITEEDVDEIVEKMVKSTNELSRQLRQEGVW
ncbi:hypothetical protein HG537_0E05900 [Torulaspora globosa]|uniref:PLP-dependent transferase n=1 Tax=Torulaspora globosa TaxID=48254 RepID=A0A7H9HU13_9SACH|nr:hypothetical protein HG537_0E05900 [Torulaspora sp. CBS 2947]